SPDRAHHCRDPVLRAGRQHGKVRTIPRACPASVRLPALQRLGRQAEDPRRPRQDDPSDTITMHNRVAFVTGASRGIGKAGALALAGSGARVALAARQKDKLEEVAAEIRSRSGEAYVVALDVASEDSIKDAFTSVAKDFGRVDILVNNAGITRDGLALRMK